MDPFTQPPRDLAIVEVAVRQALEHASAHGDHVTAAELSAILEAITLRVSAAAPASGWDTVAASARH